MKRLLVAGFAALAVLLGLVVTTGVASAAPWDHDHHGQSCTLTGGGAGVLNAGACVAVGVGGGTTVTPCPAGQHHNGAGVCVPNGTGGDHAFCPPGEHRGPLDTCVPNGVGFPGGYGGGWHPGLPWGGPTLYGHQLWVQANLGLDICGYGDYGTFLSRNALHRDAILRALGASPQQRWLALHQSDCNSNLAVVPGGLSLVNGNLLNLGLLGLQGAGTVNVCDYPDWTTFDGRFGGRFGGQWGTVRNRFGGNAFNVYRQLRVNAHCTTVIMPSSTTIVQDPNTTYSAQAPDTAPSGNDAASNPPAAAPLNSALPAPNVAPNNGGVSLAWVFAHNRAV